MIDQLESDLLAIIRAKARRDLTTYAKFVDPKYRVTPHIAEMADALMRLERGEIRRLAISIPPGHGKSRLCSQIFPSWCIGRDPTCRLIDASYSADAASENTVGARGIFWGGEFSEVFPEAVPDPNGCEARGRVDFLGGGYYMGLGVGGGWGGKRYRIGIGDDLIKGILAAQSKAELDRVWSWFRSDFLTREEMGDTAKILLVGTRWNKADPIGRVQEEQPGEWTVINMPAIKNEDTEKEEALCEEMFTLRQLRAQRKIMARRLWSGVYQQKPKADGGNMFKTAFVKRVPRSTFPKGRYPRAWDLASTVKQRTGNDPDFTVGVKALIVFAKDEASGAMIPQLWVLDVKIMREEAPKRNAAIVAAAEEDGQGAKVAVEAFGAYKDAAATVRQVLAGRATVIDLRPPGDKVAKAAPLEPIFESGNVFVPDDAPWVDQWLEQFEEFPAGTHDDCVDATSLIWWEQSAPKPGLALGLRR